MVTKLYGSLVAQPNQAAELVGQLDSADPSSRQAVLESIGALLETFVSPAGSLLSPSAEDPAHLYFDLQKIAGSDFSGLILGLLEQDFPSLQQPPADHDLESVLNGYGIEIVTSERRADFFKAWMAERAARLTRLLLRVVENNYPDDRAANAAELALLRKMLQLKLPGMERYLIESITERRSANAKSTGSIAAATKE